MSGLPQELIFVVLGLVLLFQFLLQQWRKSVEQAPDARATTLEAEAEAPQQDPLQAVLADQDEQQPSPVSPRLALTAPPLRKSVPLRANPVTALPAGPAPGRFSRAALMPDRRAVRKAFVINAILQPCHAQRPLGTH